MFGNNEQPTPQNTPVPPGYPEAPQPQAKKSKNRNVLKWGLVGVVGLAVIGALVGGNDDDKDTPSASESTISVTQPAETTPAPTPSAAPTEAETQAAAETQTTEAATESAEPEVPREYRNALREAQNYVDLMAFSKAGLYDQLTSEYGGKYPAEAAQYAIDNVKVDWFEEAVESARGYQEILPMSDSALFDQLTSEYGEKFTVEEAQYAIDNY